MDAYLAGNILGRLAFSYLLVWVGCFAFCRTDWRCAFQRTYRWYGLLIMIALFVLSIAISSFQGESI